MSHKINMRVPNAWLTIKNVYKTCNYQNLDLSSYLPYRIKLRTSRYDGNDKNT